MCGGEESGTVTYLMAFRTWGGEMYNILSTSRPDHNTVALQSTIPNHAKLIYLGRILLFI